MNETVPLRPYCRDDIDYGHEVLEGCTFQVRGPLRPPQTDVPPRTVACLGSAATFGRHVRRTYSALLAERTGAHVINLGTAGGYPERYLKEPKILELCRQADLIVLEFMSARSYASDFYTPIEGRRTFGAIAESYGTSNKIKSSRFGGKTVSRIKAFAWAAANLSPEELENIRQQMLGPYRRDACTLIRSIGRPVVMLWLSRRSIDKKSQPGSRNSWQGEFPHFIDRETVTEIGKHAIGLVDITIPQSETPKEHIKHTEDGDIVDWGSEYYASPEMHEEAARRLEIFLTGYWGTEQ
jgi:hypothetical protein